MDQTATLGLVIAVAAFGMGMAIQRGSTCAVLAVSEILRERRFDRFLSFFECGLWVALTIWLVSNSVMVPHLGSLVWVLVGGVMFGIGAAVNGACAFGSIARLGEGRLDYLLTGFSAYVVLALLDDPRWTMMPESSMIQARPMHPGIGVLFVPLLIALRAWLRPEAWRKVLALSGVMAMIGILGALLGQLHQPWPWMQVLKMTVAADQLTLIGFVALLAGSIANGLLQKRFRPVRPSLSGLRDRVLGGALMGAGSVAIPGGNDSLMLQGIPAADPRALLGYAMMLLAIASILAFVQRLGPPWRFGTAGPP